MRNLIIITTILLLACNSKKTNLVHKIEPIIKDFVRGEIDSTDMVDSLIIVNIDTASSRNLLAFKLNYLSNDRDYLNKLFDENVKKTNAVQGMLSLGYSKVFSDQKKDLVNENIRLYRSISSTSLLINKLDSLYKHSDSTDFRFYRINYRAKISNIQHVQQEVDNYILLTKDFKIKKLEDLVKTERNNFTPVFTKEENEIFNKISN